MGDFEVSSNQLRIFYNEVSSGNLPKEAGLLAEDLNWIYCFAGAGVFKGLVTCQESSIMKVSSGSLP